VRTRESTRAIVPHPEAVGSYDADRLVSEQGKKDMLLRPEATCNSMAPIVTECSNYQDATILTGCLLPFAG